MKLKGSGESAAKLLNMPLPCGGTGKCGKCKIKISGDISPVTKTESSLLSEKELAGGTRLACMCRVFGDAEADYTPAKEQTGVTQGFFGCNINPVTNAEKCTAAAFDIGTTTVAFYIYGLPEGKLISSGCFENAQKKFGADVISRICYAEKHGCAALTHALKSQIDGIKQRFCPKFSVVTGNTVMLHFYAGLDPSGIASYPFTPKTLFGGWFGDDYIPDCLSAYIGADLLCAAAASRMTERSAPSLLIDLGTNAEIALWDGSKLYCASAAAGPCFEGCGLSCGMSASDGAISEAFAANGRICYKTIGQRPPVGICGSGIIDIIAALLDLGEISQTGEIDGDYYIGNVFVTQSDIRQVQTAKAAVAAAIGVLCEKCSAAPEKLYIAGGFGHGINPKSAARTGLIPKNLSENAESLGNAAAAGAQMMLLDKTRMTNPNFNAEVTELSGNSRFAELFIENMNFRNC